ncbi:hypothetical protein [Brevundimonas subvibrioides]|uniref:hypothetical protein n=1 Tax=Brevundimonas subvibrioides TaxID=74313 RepID=UPI0022B45881|nr:hypothetical protein [Brevundimonas subvibrioides]
MPDIAEEHARLLGDTSLQFERTGFVPPEVPAWLHWVGDLMRAVAPALQYVFWGGLILLAGLIVFAIGREVLKLRGPRARAMPPVAPHVPEWRPDVGAARDLLAQADALASRGLYAEAVHLLLLRSVEDIQSLRPKALRVSLTTREIAALEAIPEGARPAFTLIGRLVERSLFGAVPVLAGDFAACRNAYEAFALPGGWRQKDAVP